LYLVSLLYGGVVKSRAAAYAAGVLKSERLPCKVMSIGNLTVGGTGKTPMTIYVADLLQQMGMRVAIVSRGYRGGAEKTGGIVSDGRRMRLSAAMAGDEPFMMAQRLEGIPVLVGAKRSVAGNLALATFAPDVLVLDDAFQHLRLQRDLDLVLLDEKRPLGNRHLIPRGPLREPVSALGRGDAFVLTRSGIAIGAAPPKPAAPLAGLLRGRPVFHSRHVPRIRRIVRGGDSPQGLDAGSLEAQGPEGLTGRRVFGFCGLARNDAFRATLAGLGCDLVGFRGFVDHHAYTARDLEGVLRAARGQGTELMVTTEKDFVRMALPPGFPLDLVVMGIDIDLLDARGFADFLSARLCR
ncbi:MAG: tetraacyldisaccharide 4'-kinase, partial [Desulfobacterales bacterium]|nr:tetraacyldisaccharide 4'-kinase [Desulfobacterales bacterium]